MKPAPHMPDNPAGVSTPRPSASSAIPPFHRGMPQLRAPILRTTFRRRHSWRQIRMFQTTVSPTSSMPGHRREFLLRPSAWRAGDLPHGTRARSPRHSIPQARSLSSQSPGSISVAERMFFRAVLHKPGGTLSAKRQERHAGEDPIEPNERMEECGANVQQD